MRYIFYTAILTVFISIIIFSFNYFCKAEAYCLTGAFLADNPTKADIVNFQKAYGKKPFFIMVFTGWGDFINEEIIKDVYDENCVLIVTWEPWDPITQEAIDYDKVLSGGYDDYISSFAKRLGLSGKQVFIRFAHEANGNWYPWCGEKISKEKYVNLYHYIKDKFDTLNTTNVKWIFSVNWEDVPKENNNFFSYYPGDKYVNFVGIDGYNWGNTKKWSSWKSFRDIFKNRLEEVAKIINKPVIISEFSSTSSGGNKAIWIREAFLYIQKNKNIVGFVLFNVDKETDWSFPPNTAEGKELELQLRKKHFRDNGDLTDF